MDGSPLGTARFSHARGIAWETFFFLSFHRVEPTSMRFLGRLASRCLQCGQGKGCLIGRSISPSEYISRSIDVRCPPSSVTRRSSIVNGSPLNYGYNRKFPSPSSSLGKEDRPSCLINRLNGQESWNRFINHKLKTLVSLLLDRWRRWCESGLTMELAC